MREAAKAFALVRICFDPQSHGPTTALAQSMRPTEDYFTLREEITGRSDLLLQPHQNLFDRLADVWREYGYKDRWLYFPDFLGNAENVLSSSRLPRPARLLSKRVCKPRPSGGLRSDPNNTQRRVKFAKDVHEIEISPKEARRKREEQDKQDRMMERRRKSLRLMEALRNPDEVSFSSDDEEEQESTSQSIAPALVLSHLISSPLPTCSTHSFAPPHRLSDPPCWPSSGPHNTHLWSRPAISRGLYPRLWSGRSGAVWPPALT